jgi:hypothetical protein
MNAQRLESKGVGVNASFPDDETRTKITIFGVAR